MEVLFATGNRHKIVEANKAGKAYEVTFKRVACSYPELRSESVREVAEAGARFVYEKIRKPVIVEDSGLFIQALDGFPGAYSAYVFRKLGNYGILRLMEETENRRAEFRSAVAYSDGETVVCFEGAVVGFIAEEGKGEAGFGFDPIFVPEGFRKTFAEDSKTKGRVSHRRKSVEGFLKWLTEEKRPLLRQTKAPHPPSRTKSRRLLSHSP